MKSLNVLLVYLFVLFVFNGVPSTTVAQPESFGKEYIDKFCAEIDNEPQPGMQFDGKEALLAVMQLEPGRYEYPNEGILLLFPNKHFLLQLPTGRNGIYGTDGGDLMSGDGIVGGCSKEQLSEAIVNNSMTIDSFELVKPYN